MGEQLEISLLAADTVCLMPQRIYSRGAIRNSIKNIFKIK